MNGLPDDAPPEEFKVRLAVSNNLAGMIIGTGGEKIKDIQSMSNTEMKISKRGEHGGNERIVTIKGTSGDVQTAIFEIMSFQKDDSTASDFFFIDYGKGGSKGGGGDYGKGDRGKGDMGKGDYGKGFAGLQKRSLKFQSLSSNSRELELSNFLGLVLGCIEAKFCK